MKLPPIPRSLELPTGRVRVTWEKGLFAKKKCAGKMNWFKRKLALERKLEGVAAWLTLEHERAHFVLMDAGVLLTKDESEAVCNAIAADRVSQMVRGR